MRRLATFATLVALAAFGLSGSALAQDDSGGASDGAATATSDSSAPAEASDATANPTDAIVADDAAAAADCPAGSAKGFWAAPTSADPFASVSWQDPAPASLATPAAGAGSIYGREPPSIGGAR